MHGGRRPWRVSVRRATPPPLWPRLAPPRHQQPRARRMLCRWPRSGESGLERSRSGGGGPESGRSSHPFSGGWRCVGGDMIWSPPFSSAVAVSSGPQRVGSVFFVSLFWLYWRVTLFASLQLFFFSVGLVVVGGISAAIEPLHCG